MKVKRYKKQGKNNSLPFQEWRSMSRDQHRDRSHYCNQYFHDRKIQLLDFPGFVNRLTQPHLELRINNYLNKIIIYIKFYQLKFSKVLNSRLQKILTFAPTHSGEKTFFIWRIFFTFFKLQNGKIIQDFSSDFY